MHALGGTGVEASCGMWRIGGTVLGKGDDFHPTSHLVWKNFSQGFLHGGESVQGYSIYCGVGWYRSE